MFTVLFEKNPPRFDILLCVFPNTPVRSDVHAHRHERRSIRPPYMRVYRYIDVRDKARERDHSLRLKLPGLSSPSFAQDGLYCRYFISEDLRPRRYRAGIQLDYRSRPPKTSCFVLPSSCLCQAFPRARNPFYGVYNALACAHTRIYAYMHTNILERSD